MKNHYSSLLFVSLLISSFFFSFSASSISSQGGDGKKELAQMEFAAAASLEEDFSLLMGEEGVVCEEKDGEEDCLKRRMVAEAHLDYIYTQHHKNP